MPPQGAHQTLLSPAELSYLSTSLSQNPPVRPDSRRPAEFRPLVAETDFLPSTNGSARVCFSDGTEAIAGVKAEVERTARPWRAAQTDEDIEMAEDEDDDGDAADRPTGSQVKKQGKGSDSWLEVSIEVPGFRDDDSLPVFLAAMLTEALLANGNLRDSLWINDRWHWKLYIDILSLSPPLSYPLPLLSLTTHLALLNSALPRLTSEPSDDPLFDDDWAAAVPLYPRNSSGGYAHRPPVTLLVITVGGNVMFDPSREELAVAESVTAISVAPLPNAVKGSALQVVAIRAVDPPSRLTPPGVPNSLNPATNSGNSTSGPSAAVSAAATQEAMIEREKGTVWSPPRGGVKRSMLAQIIKAVIEPGGVAQEVLDGLNAVET